MAAVRQPRRGWLAQDGLSLGRHRYGVLLLLILLSLGFQLAAPEGDISHSITTLLQGGTFIAALWTSEAGRRAVQAGGGVVVIVTLAAAFVFAASGRADDAGARAVSLVLVALTQVAILRGIVAHFREEGRVTVQTMFGVLCVYLLIGALFAFGYGFIDNVTSAPFFAQIENADTSDYLYFSFTTQTTTGFGDLTAATDLGRSFTIIEELLGQIYMVTVVALIVGNLRTPAPRRPA